MIRTSMSLIVLIFFAATTYGSTMVDPQDHERHSRNDHALIKGFEKVDISATKSIAFKPGDNGAFDGTKLESLIKQRPNQKFELRSYSCDDDPISDRGRIAADRAQKVREFLIHSGIDEGQISVVGPQPDEKCHVTVSASQMPAN